MSRANRPPEPTTHQPARQTSAFGSDAPQGEGGGQVLMVGVARGDKSEAVRSFIREHGNLPAPQIRKALVKQGVSISLPQIYNIKKQFDRPEVTLGDMMVTGEPLDYMPFRELNQVLEFAKKFDGGLPRLKQVVDLIWRVRQS
jgi:hypothetical protein